MTPIDIIQFIWSAIASAIAARDTLRSLTDMDVRIIAPKVGIDAELDHLSPISIARVIYAILKSRTIVITINGEDAKDHPAQSTT
jgi:hypothetical protein